MKKIIVIIMFVLFIAFLTGLTFEVGGLDDRSNILSSYSFIDDNGTIVNINNKDVSIISLSPTHSENLFEIGGDDKLVGVDVNSIYPIEALQLNRFRLDKKWDIQQIILLKPDYVLIEPIQSEKNKKLVATLESNDITVVSLLPEKFEDFDDYIKKLGIISQHNEEANLRLDRYHIELNDFIKRVGESKKTIIIETSEKGYYIPTKHHMIYQSASLAGANVIQKENSLLNLMNENQIKVGKEFLINQDNLIDSYFTISGNGYLGTNIVSFSQKANFNKMNVFKNHQVFNLSSELVGKYTFRYLDGIKEFHRLIYQEESVIKTYDFKDNKEPLTRLSFAKIVYDYYTLQTYVNDDTNYYEYPKFSHTYGGYVDVKYNHSWYHVVETITMKGYLLPIKNTEDIEFFNGDQLINKEELIQFLNIRLDSSNKENEELFYDLFKGVSKSFLNEDLLYILDMTKDREQHD